MEKWIVVLAVAIAAAGTAPAQAAPASNHSQFLKSLENILATGAAIPIADDISVETPVGLNAGVVTAAKYLLGSRVVWGGASPAQGFDCSGLVQYIFRQLGVEIPRTADLQYLAGGFIPRTALRPGDLVYFTTYAPGASHVGVYTGGGKFIHTSYSQGVVAVGDMNDPYFEQRYYGANRILKTF